MPSSRSAIPISAATPGCPDPYPDREARSVALGGAAPINPRSAHRAPSPAPDRAVPVSPPAEQVAAAAPGFLVAPGFGESCPSPPIRANRSSRGQGGKPAASASGPFRGGPPGGRRTAGHRSGFRGSARCSRPRGCSPHSRRDGSTGARCPTPSSQQSRRPFPSGGCAQPQPGPGARPPAPAAHRSRERPGPPSVFGGRGNAGLGNPGGQLHGAGENRKPRLGAPPEGHPYPSRPNQSPRQPLDRLLPRLPRAAWLGWGADPGCEGLCGGGLPRHPPPLDGGPGRLPRLRTALRRRCANSV